MIRVISASYPRSGSSWLRRGLWFYYSKAGDFPEKVRDWSPPLLEDLSQKEHFDFTPVLYKTHLLPESIPSALAECDKLIILFRDPLDTLRSKCVKKFKLYSGILNGSIANTSQLSSEKLERKLKQFEAPPKALVQGFGADYIDFYSKWLCAVTDGDMDVHFLCYEDMSNNFEATFSKLISFMGSKPENSALEDMKTYTKNIIFNASQVVGDQQPLQYSGGQVGEGANYFRDLDFDAEFLGELSDTYNRLAKESEKNTT